MVIAFSLVYILSLVGCDRDCYGESLCWDEPWEPFVLPAWMI